MELNRSIPINTETSTSQNITDLLTCEKDDIFNLNSFNKEEYIVRKKSRSSRSSSSNSSSYDSTSLRSNRRRRSKKSRSSTSSSSSSSSRSSSWSSTSSSSSDEATKKKIKSKVVLVENSTNQALVNRNESTNSRFSNDRKIYRNYRDEKYSYRRFSTEYKPRMVCTPPLPNITNDTIYQNEILTNYREPPPNYYQNVAMPNEYWQPYSAPPPVLPPTFQQMPRHYSPQYSNYPVQPRFESINYLPNQFRPLSPAVICSEMYTNTNNPPLNQYQEISSTNNNLQNRVNEIPVLRNESIKIDETEDLISFKTRLQEQIKHKLFDANDPDFDLINKQLNIQKVESKTASLSNSLNDSCSPLSTNRAVHSPKHKKRHRSKEKRHHQHRRHKKSKKASSSSRESSKESSREENSIDFSEFNSDLRRSNRIKTIETIKQHHKVLKIAEKIKNHNGALNQISEPTSLTDNIENKDEIIKTEKNSAKTQSNTEETTCEHIPMKVKDRWRRFSEIECESSQSSLPVLNSFVSNESNLSSSSNLLLKLNNNLLNSPSSSVSGTSSPGAYKKILLNKAVNELSIIQSPSYTIAQNDTNSNDKTINETNKSIDPPIGSGFELIDENIYLCQKTKLVKTNKDAKKMVCDCSTSRQERSLGMAACGDDCLNRLLMIECSNNCPCEEYCSNKNFKNKNNAPIVPFKTEMKGWGLKTNADLKPNSFLIEYVGEVIFVKEFKKRFEKYADQNIEHFYFMSLQNDLFIDATKKGNISRYFNHSCDPNCETQKWTVNGQLRIGFFTRRPVGANEELTFDYQYQTVGKKQQKCYCGSEKCRGYLGVSEKQQSSKSGGMLDYIWEDDSSDEDDDDDEIASESEEEINERSINKKAKTSEIQSKDHDLNRQIESIQSLTNKESILKLCQLMFRTENIQSRIDILNLLLNANSELSLRLFMDYHGLKLLWGWMLDIDNLYETQLQVECKIKIIKVLSSLTIKNRTTVEECKLFIMVKRWSENTENNKYRLKSIELENTNDTKEDNEKWIQSIVCDIIDTVFIAKDSDRQQLNQQIKELNEITQELFEKWNNLKVAFKIPKKQRNEERKEHEKELNDSYQIANAFYKINPEPSLLIENHRPIYNSTQFKSSFKKTKPYQRFNHYDKYNSPNYNSNSNLTKEQRRQLFEQKVKEEEEEAARLAAEEAAAAEQAIEQQRNSMELRWVFDKSLNQWIQCYMPVNMNENSSNYFQYNQQPIVDQHLMPPPHNLPGRYRELADLNATSIINPLQSSNIQNHLNGLNLSESHFHDLKQAIRSFMPEQEISENTSKEKKEHTSPTPKSNHSSVKSSSESIKLASEAKLPPNWKCKKNKKGQIYYLNIKTKKSQWHFPRIKTTSESKLSIIPNKIAQTSSDDLITSTTNDTINETNLLNASKEPTDCELSSTTNPSESSSNTFKLYKDQFRDKLSKLVIKLLEGYLRDDCKYGRIRNTDDFKHLARKFTHTIMEKELSRVTKLEELDLNKRVKTKTQEYVSQYMNKFKSGYCRNNDQV